jgi:hypothetical protein
MKGAHLEVTMNIEYIHASEYGNGAAVAEEFKKLMAARGASVSIHHAREVRPKELPPADLYLFSSPGRFGKPKREMRKALQKARLAPGTKYAILTTEAAPPPERPNGEKPAEGGCTGKQRVIPMMKEILQDKGAIEVAEDKILVTGLKGPLEEDWQKKVEAFAARIPLAG